MENEYKGLQLRRLIMCALLTAMAVVLGGFLSIPAMPLGGYSLKIGFGALPVILAGILFGPLYGGITGGLSDFLQAIIIPKGAYMPWFTVVGVLFGLIPSLFFMKGQERTFTRILLSVAAGQLTCSVVLNTAIMMIVYGYPLEVIWLRLLNQCIMIPLYSVILFAIIKVLEKNKVIV